MTAGCSELIDGVYQGLSAAFADFNIVLDHHVAVPVIGEIGAHQG